MAFSSRCSWGFPCESALWRTSSRTDLSTGTSKVGMLSAMARGTDLIQAESHGRPSTLAGARLPARWSCERQPLIPEIGLTSCAAFLCHPPRNGSASADGSGYRQASRSRALHSLLSSFRRRPIARVCLEVSGALGASPASMAGRSGRKSGKCLAIRRRLGLSQPFSRSTNGRREPRQMTSTTAKNSSPFSMISSSFRQQSQRLRRSHHSNAQTSSTLRPRVARRHCNDTA